MALLAANESLQVCKAELPNSAGLELACEGVDVVFHLAGIAHARNTGFDQYQQINVEGTRVLVDAAKRAGVKRFVYFSSILAAGVEHNKEQQVTDYAQSKKAAENLLIEAANEQFRYTIIRPVNVYGAGMKGNIASLIKRIQSGRLPPLPKLNNELPLVGIEDLCLAAVSASESDTGKDKIYSLSDGLTYTPSILEGAVYEALGRKKPGWHTPRMVFFLASLLAQIANNLGLWKNDLGLRTYRNLTDQNRAIDATNGDISIDLGFKPQTSFQSELPVILRNLKSEK